MVDAQSLWSVGAMALKLSVNSDIPIMKFGRWSILTFLQYIHEQMSHLSKGVSADMSN